VARRARWGCLVMCKLLRRQRPVSAAWLCWCPPLLVGCR